MPLTNGSGFGSGSGSCYFRHWPSRCQQKTNFLTQFFLLITVLFEGTFTSFFKDKSQKESQNSRNQGFSYYFCMLIEGSGAGSGSIPLTSGSGSGRPKNLWIRWIRIRNTAFADAVPDFQLFSLSSSLVLSTPVKLFLLQREQIANFLKFSFFSTSGTWLNSSAFTHSTSTTTLL